MQLVLPAPGVGAGDELYNSAHWHLHMPRGLCTWEGVPGVGAGQHLFALVHIVASDVAQDEDDPEEGHSTQHLHGDPQLAGAQLLGEPRVSHQ